MPTEQGINDLFEKWIDIVLYPLDQLTEGLIDNHYQKDNPEYGAIYTQFMTMLEQTVEELTKCYLGSFGANRNLSYGRCRSAKGFNELYDGLKSL